MSLQFKRNPISSCVDSTHKNIAHTATHSTARFEFHLFAPEENLLIRCPKCHLWLSRLFYAKNISSPTRSSIYETRTRSTIVTTRASPRTIQHFVDEKRYQRPVFHDQQQIGGNPRHATPHLVLFQLVATDGERTLHKFLTLSFSRVSVVHCGEFEEHLEVCHFDGAVDEGRRPRC